MLYFAFLAATCFFEAVLNDHRYISVSIVLLASVAGGGKYCVIL